MHIVWSMDCTVQQDENFLVTFSSAIIPNNTLIGCQEEHFMMSSKNFQLTVRWYLDAKRILLR